MPTGIFGSTSPRTAAPDYQVKSFDTAIARYFPAGTAPLFALTSMIRSETALNTDHSFFSKTMLFPTGTLTAAALVGDTTITVGDSSNFLPGMLLTWQNVGGGINQEILLVTAVPTATTVTVVRAIGTTAARAASISDVLVQIGNAFEEGSTRPAAMNINPIQITNYTQIFRNSWAITETAKAIATTVGDGQVAENKQDAAAFHAADIEKAIIFGQKKVTTRNGQPFRLMNGIISHINDTSLYPPIYSGIANVTAAGSTTSYTQLEAMLDPVVNQATDPKGSTERLIFAGGTARKTFNQIGRLNGTYQLIEGATTFGLQFETFKTSRCTFRVIEHPLFNSNAVWSKMALVLDLNTFCLAYLGGRKTQHKTFNTGTDVAENGLDAQGGTFTTEVTACVKNAPANAVITGLTAGAAG